MENFREMADQFLDAHAGVQVANGEQLGKVWVQLIEDNAMRERMGKAAREISERNRGATARSLMSVATTPHALPRWLAMPDSRLTARSLKRIVEVIAQSECRSRGAAANGVNAAEGNKKGSAA